MEVGEDINLVNFINAFTISINKTVSKDKVRLGEDREVKEGSNTNKVIE